MISACRSSFLSPRRPVGKTRSGWIWEWRGRRAEGELIWYFPKKASDPQQNQPPLSMSDRDTTSGNTVGTLSFQVCGWSSGFLNIFPSWIKLPRGHGQAEGANITSVSRRTADVWDELEGALSLSFLIWTAWGSPPLFWCSARLCDKLRKGNRCACFLGPGSLTTSEHAPFSLWLEIRVTLLENEKESCVPPVRGNEQLQGSTCPL